MFTIPCPDTIALSLPGIDSKINVIKAPRKTYSIWFTTPSIISNGGARFDVDKKWMLYSLAVCSLGKPARVNKKLLCSFHFFDVFPEVSSQYTHRGKDATRHPFARVRQRLPRTGFVCVHGWRDDRMVSSFGKNPVDQSCIRYFIYKLMAYHEWERDAGFGTDWIPCPRKQNSWLAGVQKPQVRYPYELPSPQRLRLLGSPTSTLEQKGCRLE